MCYTLQGNGTQKSISSHYFRDFLFYFSFASEKSLLSDKISLSFSRPSCHAAIAYILRGSSFRKWPTFRLGPFLFLVRSCGLNSRENRIFRSIGDAFIGTYVGDAGRQPLHYFLSFSLSLLLSRIGDIGDLVPFHTAFVRRNSYLFEPLPKSNTHIFHISRKPKTSKRRKTRNIKKRNGRAFVSVFSSRTSEPRQSPLQERLERQEQRYVRVSQRK